MWICSIIGRKVFVVEKSIIFSVHACCRMCMHSSGHHRYNFLSKCYDWSFKKIKIRMRMRKKRCYDWFQIGEWTDINVMKLLDYKFTIAL